MFNYSAAKRSVRLMLYAVSTGAYSLHTHRTQVPLCPTSALRPTPHAHRGTVTRQLYASSLRSGGTTSLVSITTRSHWNIAPSGSRRRDTRSRSTSSAAPCSARWFLFNVGSNRPLHQHNTSPYAHTRQSNNTADNTRQTTPPTIPPRH